MAEQDSDKPKIIVDDDWKSQAQAEKQRLAEQADKAAESPAESGGSAGSRELPPASFATLVNSLTTQVFFALGAIEDPNTKRRYVDLDLAKHHIDTLAVLEEKTQGNLSEQEKQLLDQCLYETRMQYVQVTQHLAGMGPTGPA